MADSNSEVWPNKGGEMFKIYLGTKLGARCNQGEQKEFIYIVLSFNLNYTGMYQN